MFSIRAEYIKYKLNILSQAKMSTALYPANEIRTAEILDMFSNENVYFSSQPEVPEYGIINQGLMSELDEYSVGVSMDSVLCFDESYDQKQQFQGVFAQPQSNQAVHSNFQAFDNGYCSSGSSSFPASPELVRNFDGVQQTVEGSQAFLNFSAASPADSHYSNDSGASLYNLDQPTLSNDILPMSIAELNCQNGGAMSQEVIQPMQYNPQAHQYSQTVTSQPQYQSMEQSFQYEGSYMPTTVATMQQVAPAQITFQAQAQVIPVAIASSSSAMTSATNVQPNNRKRGASGAFVSASGESSAASGNKKQRLTKRQKQQQMDKQVEDYTQKNKDLREQIQVLQRKVQLCTQFLQKYVSPIVQGRQSTWTPDLIEATEHKDGMGGTMVNA